MKYGIYAYVVGTIIMGFGIANLVTHTIADGLIFVGFSTLILGLGIMMNTHLEPRKK